jgi:SAM-dependent methyltransferase
MTHGLSMPGEPVFILDAPHYHRIHHQERHRFRGLALAIPDGGDARVIRTIVVRERGTICLEAAVDRESEDVGRFLSRLPAAVHCRFAFDLTVHASTYTMHGRFDDGAEVPLFVFEAAGASGARAMLDGASAMPVPPAGLLRRTQGGDDAESYRDSIISAHQTLRVLLTASGIDPSRVRRVLDIGCGTGRLLAGWHLDDRTRELAGADIDRECVAWTSAHLPGVARWHASELHPPLSFNAGSFDLIQLVSVFTHLSIAMQETWLRELARLVRPGGVVIVTLHGEPYAWMLDDAQRRQLAEAGHLEGAEGEEGSSAYSAFHEPGFARRLLGHHFSRVDWYPRGQPAFPPRNFPMASLQDVYVLHV